MGPHTLLLSTCDTTSNRWNQGVKIVSCFSRIKIRVFYTFVLCHDLSRPVSWLVKQWFWQDFFTSTKMKLIGETSTHLEFYSQTCQETLLHVGKRTSKLFKLTSALSARGYKTILRKYPDDF